jgi:hypothetical protein
VLKEIEPVVVVLQKIVESRLGRWRVDKDRTQVNFWLEQSSQKMRRNSFALGQHKSLLAKLPAYVSQKLETASWCKILLYG